ncbi:hypothetical protein H7J34_23555 [Mycolicibacterium alvei]|jgi:hypothetical protein|nr:hypothetical protein [Mycolicibacterium alvei]
MSMHLATTAAAAPDDTAVNGAFSAVSDGQWAKTNESYLDEATLTSTWTVTSTCSTYQDCTGTVVSDQGWTAPLVYQSGRWRVVRTLEHWEPCPDGTAAAGQQSFTFWPARRDAPDRHDLLSGWDETIGPSGACGINRSLNIRMPFRLKRIT